MKQPMQTIKAFVRVIAKTKRSSTITDEVSEETGSQMYSKISVSVEIKRLAYFIRHIYWVTGHLPEDIIAAEDGIVLVVYVFYNDNRWN